MEKFILTSAIRAISILISILSLFLVTKFLDATETGKYYNVLTWMLFISWFVRFGLDQIIVKLKNQLSCSGLDLYKRLFFIQLIIYSIFMASLLVFWEVNNLFILKNYFYIFMVLSAVIFYSNISLVSGYLIALGKSGIGNFFAVGLLPLIFIIFILFNYFIGKDINLNYLASLYFYSGLLVFIVANSVIYYFYRQIIKHEKVNFKMNRSMYYQSGRIFGFELIMFSLNWFVFFLAAIFISKEILGQLHIFARLAFFIALPLAIMVTIVSPIYAKYFKKDYKLLQNVIYIVASVATLLSITASIVMVVFSHEILSLFGIPNQENYNLFYIFVFSQFIVVIFGANSNILQMFGDTKALIVIAIYSFLGTIGMFFLINYYNSLLAVPLSLIFGYLLHNLSANYFIYKTYHLTCFPSLGLMKDLVFFRFKKIDNIFKL